ncbi:pleckstrin homology domain-containing family J member 1 isoform X5 [Tachyglossus aculeatus]|uniref:pleckstrin homology domain-containing family J member 1 isoform X5 n=1 Tax=Tachyglossus aculeatus TaxID=9261 RepID=UPI0018F42491|nr:pleckstrin homology domain-containing family J member 1 isoform X5 [Tachyglossus aculeatus]
MRYNEKELQALARQPAEKAAELGMRGPKKGSGFSEEPDRKYYFECSSEEQCQEWVEALRRASYEFMRRSLIFYRNEIQKVTGKALSPDKKGSRSGALCPPLYRPNKLCLGKKKRKNAKGEIAFYFQEEKWKRSLILPISFQERTRKPKC